MSKSITCDLFPHVRAAFRRSRQREGLCFIFPSQRASPWPGLSQLLPLRTFDAAKWSTAHPPTRQSSICAVRSSHTAVCFVDASVPLPVHPCTVCTPDLSSGHLLHTHIHTKSSHVSNRTCCGVLDIPASLNTPTTHQPTVHLSQSRRYRSHKLCTWLAGTRPWAEGW